MTSRAALIVLCLLCLGNTGLAVVPERGASTNDKAELDTQHTVAGMWHCNEQLARSVFSAEWKVTTDEAYDPEELTGTYFCAFDFPANRRRLDTITKTRWASIIQNDKEAYSYMSGGSKILNIDNAGVDLGVSALRPLDPRILALAMREEFNARIEWEDFCTAFDKFTLAQVTPQEDGLHVIEWNFERDEYSMRRLAWVNPLRGYTTERTELYMQLKSPGSKEYCDGITTTKWDSVGSTWVPVRIDMRRPVATDQTTLEIKWEINDTEVPDELFKLEAMRKEDGTKIWNRKLGEPILETIVGSNGLASDFKSDGSLAKGWLILVNVGLILVIGAAICVRRIRRH